MSELATPTINFTQNAVDKVWSLMQEEGNLALNLRVYITGGGCSGFQYGFTFDEEISDDDFVITKDAEQEDGGDGEGGDGSKAVNLLVDPMSFQYLVGADIDFQEDLQGERFVIRNPNAKTTCGCGSSFSV